MLEVTLTKAVERYLSDTFCCTAEELSKADVLFAVNPNADEPYMKIMTYKNCVVVSTSADMSARVKGFLAGKTRDEIFECPLVYGQTIHYIPDITKMKEAELPDGFAYELLEGKEINKLSHVQGFDNSLVFDENSNTSTKIVFAAKEGDQVIAIAGAGIVTDKLWEVGIDVLPGYRNNGLGSILVSALTAVILKKGVIPFYSASVTNIGSQRVAGRAGYVPSWVDTFGNVYDENYAYKTSIV